MTCKHITTDSLMESSSLQSIRHKLSNIIMGLYADELDTTAIAISELSRIITILDFIQYQPDNKLQEVNQLHTLIKSPLRLDDRYFNLFLVIFPSTFKLEDNCLVITPTNLENKMMDLSIKNTSLDVLALRSFVNKSESFINKEKGFTIHKPIGGN